MTIVCANQRLYDGDPVHAVPPLPAPHVESADATVRRIDSRELLGTAAEIEIAHRSQIYRLRRTSQGKLILTK
jgi:hemin uptake protein HemP